MSRFFHFWVIFLIFAVPNVFSYGTTCKHTVYRRLIRLADCRNAQLTEIPGDIRNNTEMVNFVRNKLRVIKNDSFHGFSDLKYAYFEYNFIEKIEEGAFRGLDNLIVLNVNKNNLVTIPQTIFALPQLQLVTLADNYLVDDSLLYNADLMGEANLKELDISNNHLKTFPSRLIFHKLQVLNISNNYLMKLRARDVAKFCSLKLLDVSNNPLNFLDPCACQELKNWINKRGIRIFPNDIINCNFPKAIECYSPMQNDKFLSLNTLVAFKTCQNRLQKIKRGQLPFLPQKISDYLAALLAKKRNRVQV